MTRRPTLLLLTAALAFGTIGAADASEPKCDSDADACVKWMIQNFENKGWIGIELDYSEGKSPRITRVLGSSPAKEAGLTAGDTLIALDDIAYATATEEQLRAIKQDMVPGREVQVTVERDGETVEIPLTLGRIPQSVLAQWIGTHLLEGHGHQYAEASTD